MKNSILLLVGILLFPFVLSAQEFPDFGAINREELAIKECSFDKDAPAMVLINEAVADYDNQNHLITYHHVKIKILKEKGFDYANVSLRFYRKDDFEYIDMVEGVILNTDGNGDVFSENLSKKAIYTKDINDRFGAVIFTFPGIKVGSVIEYKYRSVTKSAYNLEDWEFQDYIPVVKSKFTLTVLPTAEFTYRINKREDMQVAVKMDKESGKVFYEMDNIPALTNEPYMDAREDYLQKVTFQLSGYNDGRGKSNYMTSWDEVIKEMLNQSEFGSQLGKNIPGTGAFIDGVKKMPAVEDRMRVVYDYVRRNIKWNNMYGKYALDGVKGPWEKRRGTSGEINLILVNLLKDADLEAYPALVSPRYHGKVEAAVPFVDQFLTVFACVFINSKKYYLDAATNDNTPAHIIPSEILNTNALIVNRKKGGLVTVTNDSLQYSDYISTQLQLDENGVLSGETYIKSDGYSRIEKVSDYKEDGKEKYVNTSYQNNGITIKDFEFLNLENDSLPAEQKFKFTTSLAGSGDYVYVPLNLFTGFERNPFIGDNRFSNVNFGYKRVISTYSVINLPKNYNLDVLPKPVKMTTPDKDIVFSKSVTYDKEAHSLVCMLMFDFRKSLYSVDEYPILKEVYKKMFDYLKEPVVLKKK